MSLCSKNVNIGKRSTRSWTISPHTNICEGIPIQMHLSCSFFLSLYSSPLKNLWLPLKITFPLTSNHNKSCTVNSFEQLNDLENCLNYIVVKTIVLQYRDLYYTVKGLWSLLNWNPHSHIESDKREIASALLDLQLLDWRIYRKSKINMSTQIIQLFTIFREYISFTFFYNFYLLYL